MMFATVLKKENLDYLNAALLFVGATVASIKYDVR